MTSTRTEISVSSGPDRNARTCTAGSDSYRGAARLLPLISAPAFLNHGLLDIVVFACCRPQREQIVGNSTEIPIRPRNSAAAVAHCRPLQNHRPPRTGKATRRYACQLSEDIRAQGPWQPVDWDRKWKISTVLSAGCHAIGLTKTGGVVEDALTKPPCLLACQPVNCRRCVEVRGFSARSPARVASVNHSRGPIAGHSVPSSNAQGQAVPRTRRRSEVLHGGCPPKVFLGLCDEALARTRLAAGDRHWYLVRGSP